jgi:hypothetical protein
MPYFDIHVIDIRYSTFYFSARKNTNFGTKELNLGFLIDFAVYGLLVSRLQVTR